MRNMLPVKMAKDWICLFVVFFCFMEISNGRVNTDDDIRNQNPPLIDFGSTVGDKEIEKYNEEKKIPLDFNITYFGSSYDSIYISKDGLIGFVKNVKYIEGATWSEGIQNADADHPFMAPFYHNGYNPTWNGPSTYQGKIHYRLIHAQNLETAEGKSSRHYAHNVELMKYLNEYVKEAVINAPDNFNAELAAIITWAGVTDKKTTDDGDCDAHSRDDTCESATFQVVIIADKENTFAMFNYLRMDIPYQDSYQAGFNGGYGRGWFNVIPCLAGCGDSSETMNPSQLNNLPNLNGSDIEGRYFLNVGGETIVRGGCLPTNISAGMLEVFPREIGMFGGEKLEVSGKCLKAQSKIYCKFGQGSNTFETEGVMTNDMKGYCPVPIMTIRGSVQLSWSSDGEDWSATKDITVVVPWMVDDVATQMSESEMIPLYKRDADSLTVKWSSERMSSENDARVQIKLIGYKETSKESKFEVLKNLGETRNSDGSFTFRTADHACTKNCEASQIGLLEVGLVNKYFGDASNRVAVRYGPIPLGWYVNRQLSETIGKHWSKDICRRWYDQESKKDITWLNDLPKCPCNLDQALADFGRWQAHPGCDLFAGEKCIFHKAMHCVSSVQPSSSGGDNLCCYHSDKTLMHNQLAFYGGAPSTKHPLGVHPYNSPGKVPSMSYMKHDIIPYIQCCQWMEDDNDICHHYTKLRPTTDCVDYEAPGLALVRGDPHITTFDGSTYQFGGKGDFWLVNLPDIDIQGRFQSRRGSWDLGSLVELGKWKPIALTHLAIQGSGVPIQIYVAPENAVRRRGLDILVGKDRHFFYTMSTKWQEFGGEVIINNALSMDDNPHNNFTIITNNVGINVVAVNNLLHVTVALPPSMKNKGPMKGMGLLGMYDGNPDNDYVSISDEHVSSGADPEELFQNFSKTWAVSSMDSLFPVPMSADQHSDYKQYYLYDEIPHDFGTSPNASLINSTCDEDVYCKWDYRITGSQKVAMATKDANDFFFHRLESASDVETCGLPAIGDMAVLSSNDFSVGEEFTVTGCHGDHKFGGSATFKCVKERLDVAKGKGRDDYGYTITDSESLKHIVHWVPKPTTICEESAEDKREITGGSEIDTEGASTGMIAGIVVGVIVAIIIIVIIVVMIRKKRNGGDENIARREQGVVDGTDEPMMSGDKEQGGAANSTV